MLFYILWLYHFTFPSTVYTRILISPHPHQDLFSGFLITAILMGMKWYLIVPICISLMISDVQRLYLCLLAICISSLEKCLFKFFAHFFEMGWILLLSFRSSVCILDSNRSSDMWFGIFSAIDFFFFYPQREVWMQSPTSTNYAVKFLPFGEIMGQHTWSAMEEPCHGKTTSLIMVSLLPDKYCDLSFYCW